LSVRSAASQVTAGRGRAAPPVGGPEVMSGQLSKILNCE
jgi:hypothetical protein